MNQPIILTAGAVTEVVFLAPDRPHTVPDERGCPDCGQPAYDSGCEAYGCNGWGCPDCGAGCDLDFADEETGRCAQYRDDQDDDEEDAS